MVANPMQRKARVSFLIGVVITLVICAIIGGLLFFLMSRQEKQQEQEEGALTYAYKLKVPVKSGEEINASKVEAVLVTEKAVPTGAFAAKTKISGEKGKETWVDKAFPSGYKSKLDLQAGTILFDTLVYEDEELTNDTRYVEYNMLTLSTTVGLGDYIDIRLTLSNGQDLIVISKKEIKTLYGDTIGLELTEPEILMMESAIVEAYRMTASKLYAIQYVEPGMQEAAGRTYIPTTEVQMLIERNPNIVAEARSELVNRFNSEANQALRGNINTSRNEYAGNAQANLEEGMQTEIENAKSAREAYLSGLESY